MLCVDLRCNFNQLFACLYDDDFFNGLLGMAETIPYLSLNAVTNFVLKGITRSTI